MLAATATARTLPTQPAVAQSAYVHPGRLAASPTSDSMTTVVGSGAVVCIWDPSGSVSGMAHFLLPEKGSAPPAPRFGDVALAQLLDELKKLGAAPFRLRAAVFGGSAPPIGAAGTHLGDRNVEAATAFLVAHAIPVLQRDVGGAGGRKVIFTPAHGRAEVVRLHGA
jgi:chemotaxis protein CheD